MAFPAIDDVVLEPSEGIRESFDLLIGLPQEM